MTQVYPGTKWQTRSPEEVGLSEAKLRALEGLVGGRGCVMRQGFVVYTWGDQSKSGDVASAVKPVISTLLLFAVQEGKLGSVDDRAADFEPGLKRLNDGKDASITWRHLASQTSGYGLVEAPGEAYAYNDYALALYYDILTQKVFKESGTDILKTRLADVLQFEDPYTFQAFGPNDRPGRLAISVQDFARFGLLILRGGKWKGRQVLLPKFLELAISSPISADTPLTSGAEAEMLPDQRSLGGSKNITSVGPGYYSFNWWLNRLDKEGRRLYVDAPPDTYVASGHGGKRTLWIIPSLDLIVSWNDADVKDHDDSPGNPDTKCNRAARLIRQAVKWVWPEADWATASPESQGMSSATLDKAAAYAQDAGGGSGCVIRRGVLVKEWGSPTTLADIKSAAKGSMGATSLGLALDTGLVALDDLAQKHYPAIGSGKAENVATGWLGEITIRHLATMTAGFDDGRPPLLVYRPGTSGIYSNDTSNMLAELLTTRFNEDLYPLVKRKVMDPIGVPGSQWTWRDNNYRPDTVSGLKSREFASGIKITHRALARIGYLYLRQGRWKDRQILSKEFIKEATQPTSLPGPWPYYAFYWGSNDKGTFKGMPRDTYWAFGLGDSFVAVMPSLDLVVVRLGVGSKRSQLPGGDEWGSRVEKFSKIIVDAVQDWHPPSPAIKEVTWAPVSNIMRKGEGSDNWPLAWADDDNLYTAYGDGWGFEPKVPEKLSLGFARVLGSPPEFSGVNIRSPSGEKKGQGKSGKKTSGILMVDGTLYIWVRNAGNSQLASSSDYGKTWTWSDWKFTISFGCPTFLNFGKNYAGARDEYVYIYSHDADSAYVPADRMVMARVPKDKITNRDAYEFFKGLNPEGGPIWTEDIQERGAVFTNPGMCYRSAISHNAGLGRYLWCQIHPGGDTRYRGGFSIYDAPEPWGPWTTVYSTEEWDVGPGETNSFPTKWMSADGKTCHLVFSGDDNFSVRKVTFTLSKEVKGGK